MNEVAGRRVADFNACTQPGDYYLTDPNPHEFYCRRLSFLCPCGCGLLCGIRISDDGSNHTWTWNGDEHVPTASPSININNGHWHGFLVDGIFKSC